MGLNTVPKDQSVSLQERQKASNTARNFKPKDTRITVTETIDVKHPENEISHPEGNELVPEPSEGEEKKKAGRSSSGDDDEAEGKELVPTPTEGEGKEGRLKEVEAKEKHEEAKLKKIED